MGSYRWIASDQSIVSTRFNRAFTRQPESIIDYRGDDKTRNSAVWMWNESRIFFFFFFNDLFIISTVRPLTMNGWYSIVTVLSGRSWQTMEYRLRSICGHTGATFSPVKAVITFRGATRAFRDQSDPAKARSFWVVEGVIKVSAKDSIFLTRTTAIGERDYTPSYSADQHNRLTRNC